MNRILAIAGLCCFVLLAGCSSPPKLTLPSGDWEDFNPPAPKVVPVNKGAADVQKK